MAFSSFIILVVNDAGNSLFRTEIVSKDIKLKDSSVPSMSENMKNSTSQLFRNSNTLTKKFLYSQNLFFFGYNFLDIKMLITFNDVVYHGNILLCQTG